MLLLIGVSGGPAQAAIDMAAKVDMELVARTASGTGSAEDFLVRDGGVLRTGDGLQLRLASEVKAYVYIIAYGSSHTAMVLHPFSARPDDALMRPGQQARGFSTPGRHRGTRDFVHHRLARSGEEHRRPARQDRKAW
jgi:hypothetical protein